MPIDHTGIDMQSTTRRTIRHPAGQTEPDTVVVEEPLEMRVEGISVAVTMRTPGHDLDLATGFLVTEGIIDARDDIAAIGWVDEADNVVDVRLASGVAAHQTALDQATRSLFASSSCGLCGKSSLDRLLVCSPPFAAPAQVDGDHLLALSRVLRDHQPTFALTGGLHAAALFDADGACLVAREDVGRHNAVDKVIGAALRHDIDVTGATLLVSSRAGFELVQKALVARIPVLAAAGAATSLAIDLAHKSNLVLVSFLRDARFNRYPCVGDVGLGGA